MKTRANFDFSSEKDRIKRCKGYVIGELTLTETGSTFKPERTVILKLNAVAPDWEKVEQLAVIHSDLNGGD